MFQQGRDKQMKVKELKAEGLQKKYTVTIENKDFEEKVENKLNNLAKTIKLPGFRPGKAPKEMLLDEGMIIPLQHQLSLNVINLKEIGGWAANAFDFHPLKYLYRNHIEIELPNVEKR